MLRNAEAPYPRITALGLSISARNVTLAAQSACVHWIFFLDMLRNDIVCPRRIKCQRLVANFWHSGCCRGFNQLYFFQKSEYPWIYRNHSIILHPSSHPSCFSFATCVPVMRYTCCCVIKVNGVWNGPTIPRQKESHTYWCRFVNLRARIKE